jgi:hypothetical protein
MNGMAPQTVVKLLKAKIIIATCGQLTLIAILRFSSENAVSLH